MPQNVYQLDTERLKQFKQKNGEPLRKSLRPGDTFTLPNGAGSLKFERLERWASFQVSQQPGNYWALGGSVLAIVGLAGSLFIQQPARVGAYGAGGGRPYGRGAGGAGTQ